MMTKLVCGVVAVLVAGGALAQEAPKYDVLKKMYDDAQGSLKEAQAARNQLAARNEELGKQVAELTKQLDAVMKERDGLQRESVGYAEKTFNLRAHYAAWQDFMKRYPALNAKWKVFLEGELLRAENEAPALGEPGWPFKLEG